MTKTDFDGVEIANTRVFPYTATRLWQALSDPAQVMEWWGPMGFTNRFHVFDFREGGRWHMTMVSPNGAEFENDKTFLEIVPEQRILFEHHQPVHHFLMSQTLEPAEGGMRLSWRMNFSKTSEVTEIEQFLRAANEQNFDRLADFLETN